MQIDHPHVLRCPAFKDNYIWLIHYQGNAVVVDPGDAQVVLCALQAQALTLKAILITHHHADHVGGLLELKRATGATVYGPGDESIEGIDVVIGQDDTIKLADLNWSLKVLHVPGHTRGHLALFGAPLGDWPQNLLFCGDTLFAAGCGRLFEGTAAQMWHSLNQLKALPQDTLIYCAHEYTQANLEFAMAAIPQSQDIKIRTQNTAHKRALGQASVPSTIALERATNPYFLASSLAQFAALRQAKDSYRPGQSLDPALLNP
jgi:hydroxyacylglutathione hydrolase